MVAAPVATTAPSHNDHVLAKLLAGALRRPRLEDGLYIRPSDGFARLDDILSIKSLQPILERVAPGSAAALNTEANGRSLAPSLLQVARNALDRARSKTGKPCFDVWEGDFQGRFETWIGATDEPVQPSTANAADAHVDTGSRKRGRIKAFFPEKRFGFIASDVGDIFVHQTSITGDLPMACRTPDGEAPAGPTIDFDLVFVDGQTRAVNACIIQDGQESGPIDFSGDYSSTWGDGVSTIAHTTLDTITVASPLWTYKPAEGKVCGNTISLVGWWGTFADGVISWSNGCTWTRKNPPTPWAARASHSDTTMEWEWESANEWGELYCGECGLSWRWNGQGKRCHGRWYCDACYGAWVDSQESVLQLAIPRCQARYQGKAIRSYGGRQVHVLQIGLGNFATFIHRDKEWIDIMLDASSWWSDGGALRGIGVDANESSAGPLESDALSLGMDGASVVLAAIGEEEGTAKLIGLPYGARDRVRREMTARGFDSRTRAYVDVELAFMENMACIEALHSNYMRAMQAIKDVAHLATPLMEERAVPLHTFDSILRLHDAKGCDVLIVDAEGSDVSIMRSMMAACQAGRHPWPRAIRVECTGHSDQRERCKAEEEIIRRLQEEAGYLVIAVSCDVTLVHGPTMSASAELSAWAEPFKVSCRRCGWYVSPSTPDYAASVGPGFEQWMGDPAEYYPGGWCCKGCLSMESDALSV